MYKNKNKKNNSVKFSQSDRIKITERLKEQFQIRVEKKKLSEY